MMMLWAVLAWVLFLAMAIVCGWFRDAFLTSRLGDGLARAVMTLVLCVILFAVTGLFTRVSGLDDAATAWKIGVWWTGATLAFETAMGRLVLRAPWPAIWGEYAFWRGRLWIAVLLTTLCAPVCMVHLRG